MATTIEVNYHNGLALLTLSNGVTNPLSPTMVQEFSQALAAIKEEAAGLVLSGGEKFFSLGLNLPDLITMDRPAMTEFWQGFNQLVLDLYTLPIPTVCAIAGHAVAGGNILALSCDYRLATTEIRKMGLNEVHLGIPVPLLAALLLKNVVGPRHAARMMYSGSFMTPAEAEQLGLVDQLHPPEQLKEAAVEKAAELASRHTRAFAIMKATLTGPVVRAYLAEAAEQDAAFLDCWFEDDVQEGLKEAAKKF